jgi:hypothetical protein
MLDLNSARTTKHCSTDANSLGAYNALPFCCSARPSQVSQPAATTKGSESAAAGQQLYQQAKSLDGRCQQQWLVGLQISDCASVHARPACFQELDYGVVVRFFLDSQGRLTVVVLGVEVGALAQE